MTGERVLIAGEDAQSAATLKRVLAADGFVSETAPDGKTALESLHRSSFDILLTDLKMNGMDGMELMTRVGNQVRPVPLIVMISQFQSPEIHRRALETGAYDFLPKPLDFKNLLKSFHDGLLRRKKRLVPEPSVHVPAAYTGKPPFAAVVIAASTGGPQTIDKLFHDLRISPNVACFIVQHGPDWMLKLWVEQLHEALGLKTRLAADKQSVEPGTVYIAPGDRHLEVDSIMFTLRLTGGIKENYVRPAADVLFRSAATAFGPYCIAAVLSGLGADGALGAERVAAMGGMVLIQDPKTATAPFMPQAAVEAVASAAILPLDQMGRTITAKAAELAAKLGLK